MALWSNDTNAGHDVYTIVYLVKDALQSALDDAWFFERTACQKPEVKGAGHAEIAARLGRFRSACNVFKEREALMLTKIMRARSWAIELRKQAPDLQEGIDQFLDSTDQCEKLQAQFMRDLQRMFNGGQSPSRFVAMRRGEDEGHAGQTGQGQAYLVGGQTASFGLRAACEVFLGEINNEFFRSDAQDGARNVAADQFLSMIEARENPNQQVH